MSSSAHEGSVHSRGMLFVVSAPSGTGKTTVVEKLAEGLPGVELSRSYTSRPAREGERDGVDYHFISRERFEAMIAAGEFLEWADVFGNYYGTCAADTERLLAQGRDVILVIDVQGAAQVRARGLALVSIFVLPPILPHSGASAAGAQQGQRPGHPPIAWQWPVRRSRAITSTDYLVINDSLARPWRRCGRSSWPSAPAVARMRHEADRII